MGHVVVWFRLKKSRSSLPSRKKKDLGSTPELLFYILLIATQFLLLSSGMLTLYNYIISRLVQQVKDINSTKAELSSITNKIQAEYENVVAVRRLRDAVSQDMERIIMLLHAKQFIEVITAVEGKQLLRLYLILYCIRRFTQ